MVDIDFLDIGYTDVRLYDVKLNYILNKEEYIVRSVKLVDSVLNENTVSGVIINGELISRGDKKWTKFQLEEMIIYNNRKVSITVLFTDGSKLYYVKKSQMLLEEVSKEMVEDSGSVLSNEGTKAILDKQVGTEFTKDACAEYILSVFKQVSIVGYTHPVIKYTDRYSSRYVKEYSTSAIVDKSSIKDILIQCGRDTKIFIEMKNNKYKFRNLMEITVTEQGFKLTQINPEYILIRE